MVPVSFDSTELGSPRKRRKNNRQGQTANRPPKKVRRDYGINEESRQLTHEEVWDDSALIQAWDAAVEEYKVLNGPDKNWKSEPVNKSVLWFNIPPEQETSVSSGPSFLTPVIPAESTAQTGEQDLEPADPENSQPENFDTFIPRHDPALSHAQAFSYPGIKFPPAPPGVSGHSIKDEAFQQAVGAWYWAGYWTGIYHSTGGKAAPDAEGVEDDPEDEQRTTTAAIDGVERQQDEDVVVQGLASEMRVE